MANSPTGAAPRGLTRLPLPRRLGLLGDGHDVRFTWLLIGLALALYTVGYAAFYPRGATVDDESSYLEVTQLWVETGSFRIEKIDPLTGAHGSFIPSTYPVGTIVLMAPFVKAFGWRGGFLASFLCLLIAVLATARWLQEERRSPAFALILLAFPAFSVGGRLAMSDIARTAFVALGLWWFFRGLDGHKGFWVASGFMAGAALTLRESAVLPFIPLFAGTLLRRDRGWVWLLSGGVGGTALHLVANQLVFGDPLFVRDSGYEFDLATIEHRLLLYSLGLLVLVPGGLAFGLAYRGRRRPELVITLVLYVGFYLSQAFGMIESGFLKRLVNGLRYFDPLLPILAFAMAESAPRLLGGWLGRRRQRARWEGLAGVVAGLGIGATSALAFIVHPTLDLWAAKQVKIRDTIAATVPVDAVLVANSVALRKFIDDLARPYITLHRDRVSIERLDSLPKRYGSYMIALLDRSDSAFWRADAAQNARFVASLGNPTPLIDLRVSATDRLRIWRIEAKRP